jgi:DNA-binding transcriptional LysR family regulator
MPEQKRTDLDWDDVRVFLVFAQAGSLSGAARRLGVNHATVARRLAELEQAFGGRALIEKRADGYALTPAGEAALAEARRMELAAEAFRRAADAAEDMTGPVRVSAVVSFADHVLAGPLARLAQAHPGLRLELAGESRNVRLGRGEADIAIRFGGRGAEDEALVRQLGVVGYHLYGAAAYLARTPPAARRLIGFSETPDAAPTAAARLAELAGGAPFVLRCSTFAAQASAAAEGLGLALLPPYVADRTPGLARAQPGAERAWSQPVWLVLRADVRRVARVRRVADALAEEIRRRAAEISGADEPAHREPQA